MNLQETALQWNLNLTLSKPLKVLIHFLEIGHSIIIKKGFEKFLEEVIHKENKRLGEIQIIFTDNKNILEINRSFLNHHYYTDVITFAQSKRNTLSGDIYISVDQVYTNSKLFNVSFLDELGRVIIHGVLHLIGYGDKSENEQSVMRQKEDDYLCWLKKYDLIAEREIKL